MGRPTLCRIFRLAWIYDKLHGGISPITRFCSLPATWEGLVKKTLIFNMNKLVQKSLERQLLIGMVYIIYISD